MSCLVVEQVVQFCRMMRLKRAEFPDRHLVYTCKDEVDRDQMRCDLMLCGTTLT